MVYVTTVRKLKHVDSARASSQLRPFLATAGGPSVVTLGTAGTDDAILLQGFASRVAEALRLLDEVDQPSQLKLPRHLEARLQGMETRLAALEKQSRSTPKK